MKVYVLYNQRFCEIRGVYSSQELAMENASDCPSFCVKCKQLKRSCSGISRTVLGG